MKLCELRLPVCEVTGIQQPTVSHEKLKAWIDAGQTVQQIAQAGNVGVATIVRQTQIRLPNGYLEKLKLNNKKAGINFSARVEVSPGRTPTYSTPSDFDAAISKRIPEVADWISQGFTSGAITTRLGVTRQYFNKVRLLLSLKDRMQLDKNNYQAKYGWNVGNKSETPIQTRPVQTRRPQSRLTQYIPKFLKSNDPRLHAYNSVQRARADKERHLQRQLELD